MSSQPSTMEDIAIVGLACRLPGEATSEKNLWNEVLVKGKSTWSEFPSSRFNVDGFHHPDNQRQGSLAFRGAHFLKNDLSAFDCSFFDMNPNDAVAADPQQRALMEVSYEALQNAGVRLEDMPGTDAGVFVASFVKDYEQITLRDTDYLPQYAATGTANALLANRLSHFYNISGPSMTVDTACSGSLVAVHLAVQSLRTNETSMAIVGGSNLILSPDTMFPMDAMGLLSPDGRCYTFDSRANGYGRGEAVGVVILKRLSDAIKSNDAIRAVIRGSRVNHDGRTPGITMPNKDAQAQNIRETYRMAGLDCNQTGYVECHGTGTKAGDPTELAGISESLCQTRSADEPLVVGSIKANIGHSEGAAGVAGLIKSVLCLEKGMIPPNANFKEPNPAIRFDEWKIKVPLEMTPWPIDGPRRASINSFGFGGTNAHVILDEAGWYLAERGLNGNHCSAPYTKGPNCESPSFSSQDSSTEEDESSDGEGSPQSESSADSGERSEMLTVSVPSRASSPATDELSQVGPKMGFPISCGDKANFAVFVDRLISYLQNPGGHSPGHLRDFAHTLSARSSALKWRTYFVDNSASGLIEQLKKAKVDGLVQASPKPTNTCFVFGGQGGVWAEMGRALLCFKPFKESLEKANSFMKTELSCPFDLLEELARPRNATFITSPFVSQPITTALQVALVDLIGTCGIVPQYVVGHSSGEIAAAYAASAISSQQAWALAYFRGLHAVWISRKHPHINGGMIAVAMSAEEAEKYVPKVSGAVQVACINSSTSVTLSGDRDGIHLIAADLAKKDVFHKVLDIPVAYHSRHMDLIVDSYKSSLGKVVTEAHSDGPVMLSSLHGRVVTAFELDLEYWAQNLTNKVRFADALRAFEKVESARRPGIFIEIGPSGGMRKPTLDTVDPFYSATSKPEYMSLLKTGMTGIEVFLSTLGNCWTRGVSVKLHEAIEKNANFAWLGIPRYLSDVPREPWNHSRRFWHESHLGTAHRGRSSGRGDLVGKRSLDSNEYRSNWIHFLRLRENPWIRDHQIQKTILYPAAGMITMVVEAFSQLTADREDLAGVYLTSFAIERPMVVPESDHGLEVSMVLTNLHADDFEHSFDILSKNLNGQWKKNASGRVKLRRKSDVETFEFAQYGSRWSSLESRDKITMHPSQLYAALEDKGLGYGPMFRNIKIIKLIHGDVEESRACVSTIRVPDTKAKMPKGFEYPHLIHPATLDSMMQTLFAVKPTSMVPTGIDKIWISADLVGKAGVEFKGYSTGIEEGTSGALGTVAMTTNGWEVPSVVMDGARFTKMAALSVEEGGFIPFHRNLTSEISWLEDITEANPEELERFLLLLAHKYPGLSILQLDVDTSLTERVLNTLHPRLKERCHLSRYTICDDKDGTDALEEVRILFKDSPVLGCVEARKYNPGSGEAFPEYNLVIAKCTSDVLKDLQGRLLPGGFILELFGNVKPSTSEKRPEFLLENEPHDSKNVERTGIVNYSPLNLQFWLHQKGLGHQWSYCREVVFLTPDEPSTVLKAMVSDLRVAFQKKGIKARGLKLSTLAQLASGRIGEPSEKAHIFHSGMPCVSFLSVQEGNDFLFDWAKGEFDAFKYLVKKSKSILWLTRNVYMPPLNPLASLITGLARTLMSEDPSKKIVTLDLGGTKLSVSWANTCLEVFGKSFLADQVLEPRDVEYVEDRGRLMVPRLRPLRDLNAVMEGNNSDDIRNVTFAEDTERLKLVLKRPGKTDDSRSWESLGGFMDEMRPSEVEIQFVSAPLLDEDYETALGHTTLASLGLDVCGRIRKVGGGVHDLEVGDVVVGIVLEGSFQNIIRLDRGLVAKVPGNDVELGSKFLLSCYLAAWYAIHPIMQHTSQRKIFGGKKRSILINNAASAHGQAAVILAQAAEFEVYVTTCHESTKKTLLELGIHGDHIIPLGALSYWDGEVDVAYDPTGSHFSQSAHHTTQCYSSLGSNSRSRQRALSIQLSNGRPQLVRNIDLRTMLADGDARMTATGIIAQLQFKANHGLVAIDSMNGVETRNLADMSSALSEMADDCPSHRIFSFGMIAPNTKIAVATPKRLASLAARIFSLGAYVLVGAFGGLGEMIADLLVGNGAKTLVFFSRRGAESPKAQALCDRLKKRGVQVIAYAVDVADHAALKLVWKSLIRRVNVLGVVQCAAVFKDRIFDNMTHEDWVAATRPKTVGSWNLFSLMQESSTTFFGQLRQKPWILFLSSASGVIGNRGQASYAAGNVFQDALAHHAKFQGFHAASLDFGPVLGAGILEREEGILDTLRASGFFGIQPDDFLTVVESAICGEVTKGVILPTQVVVGVGTGGLVHQNRPLDPYWARSALYSVLSRVDLPPGDLSELSESNARLADPNAAGGGDNTAEGIAQDLAAVFAKNMSMKATEVDLHKPLENFGVDSLVATAVRSWVFTRTGVTVSSYDLMGGKSIEALATMLMEKMVAKG